MLLRRSTIAFALSAALIGSTGLAQLSYAQSTTDSTTAAQAGATQTQSGDASSKQAPAGDVSGKADVNAAGSADATCPDGTPMPQSGACPPEKMQAGKKPTASNQTGGGVSKGGNAAAASDSTSGGKTSSSGSTAAGADTNNASKANSSTSVNVNVTTDQRTTIVNEIKTEHVAPVSVNFTVNVGIAVPHEVKLRPLPASIIHVVPHYRGFLFFLLADGRIVIVEPHTLKIVLII